MFDSPCVAASAAFTTRDEVLINCSNKIFILGFHQSGTTHGWWCKSMNNLWEITIPSASWRLSWRWRWRWWKRLCICWDMMVNFSLLNGCSNWSHNFCHGVDLNGWLIWSTSCTYQQNNRLVFHISISSCHQCLRCKQKLGISYHALRWMGLMLMEWLYRSPRTLTVETRMVFIFWAWSPIFSKHTSLWYPFLGLHQTTYLSNIYVQLRCKIIVGMATLICAFGSNKEKELSVRWYILVHTTYTWIPSW